MCDKGFIWNPSNCECECDKSCDVGEYLDYEMGEIKQVEFKNQTYYFYNDIIDLKKYSSHSC